MKVAIGKAAEELGVTRETLRRWEQSGKITSERTKKGQMLLHQQKKAPNSQLRLLVAGKARSLQTPKISQECFF